MNAKKSRQMPLARRFLAQGALALAALVPLSPAQACDLDDGPHQDQRTATRKVVESAEAPNARMIAGYERLWQETPEARRAGLAAALAGATRIAALKGPQRQDPGGIAGSIAADGFQPRDLSARDRLYYAHRLIPGFVAWEAGKKLPGLIDTLANDPLVAEAFRTWDCMSDGNRVLVAQTVIDHYSRIFGITAPQVQPISVAPELADGGGYMLLFGSYSFARDTISFNTDAATNRQRDFGRC